MLFIRFKIAVIFLTLFLNVSTALGGFYFQHSINYQSETEDSSQIETSTMRNSFLLGASFGKNKNWIIGQSFHMWSRDLSTGGSVVQELSMLELGPRVLVYLNRDLNFYVSFNYNFYAKGSRTKGTAAEADVEGTSIRGGMGYMIKLSRTTYIGISLNYHSLSLSESKTGSTTTDISESVSDIYPAFEWNLRF